MKTCLLFAGSNVIAMTSGAVPSLPGKLILGAFVLLGALTTLARRAPLGYQDESGFHLIRVRGPAPKWLGLWRARKRRLKAWAFPRARRPAQV
jgi:hypothetical protein